MSNYVTKDQLLWIRLNIKAKDHIRNPVPKRVDEDDSNYVKSVFAKYIHTIYDLRTGRVYAIKFVGYGGGEITFALVNENKDRDMVEWIIDHREYSTDEEKSKLDD